MDSDRASAVDIHDFETMQRASAVDITDFASFPIPFPSHPFDPDNCVDVAFESLSDDEMCDVTGFTGAEKKLIWESWKEMANSHENRVALSKHLIAWINNYIPIMPKRFIDGWAKEIGNDAATKKFTQHAYSLIRELHMVVALLPAPIEMMSRINDLMGFHVSMSPMVGTKYFKPFHRNFSKFVSEPLGQPTDSQIVQLWVSLIGIFYRVMDDKETDMSIMSADTKSTAAPVSETKEGFSKEETRKTSSCCCSLM